MCGVGDERRCNGGCSEEGNMRACEGRSMALRRLKDLVMNVTNCGARYSGQRQIKTT